MILDGFMGYNRVCEKIVLVEWPYILPNPPFLREKSIVLRNVFISIVGAKVDSNITLLRSIQLLSKKVIPLGTRVSVALLRVKLKTGFMLGLNETWVNHAFVSFVGLVKLSCFSGQTKVENISVSYPTGNVCV